MHFLSHSKTLLLGALFSVVSFSTISSMELIAANSVSSPEPVQLFKNHKDLFVQDENAAYRVEKHNMNPLLQEVMQRKATGKFTEKGQGYFRVKQLSDGKYSLEAKVRGKGGGPILAGAVYVTVKVTCYGAALAAATAAAVATGGAAAAVTGAASPVITAALLTSAGAHAPVVVGASTLIASAGLTEVATTATIVAVTGPGGIAGAVVAVEGAASTLAAWALALPTW